MRNLVLLGAALGLATVCCGSPVRGSKSKTEDVLLGVAYRLEFVTAIQGVHRDASGITYSAETGTLFGVVNSTSTIFEIDRKGHLLRLIPTTGFADVEDIAFLEKDRFALVEERRGTVCLVRIGKDTRGLCRSDASVVAVDIGEFGPLGNHGLEGLGYDAARRLLYLVKEKKPRVIIAMRVPSPAGPGGGAAAEAANAAKGSKPLWDIEKQNFGLSDLSGVYHHARTDHLLILSDASQCVLETSRTGRVVSRLSLRKGSAGLDRSIPQAEGITMDDEGTLYIVSEPDLFYVFKPAHPPGP